MPSQQLQPRKRGANIKRLNPQQQIFVECLLKDDSFNPTHAARSAGYKTPSQCANKLMKNEIVLHAIGKSLRERKEELRLDGNRVLKELTHIAFADPADLFDDNGNLLNIKDMPEGIRRAISSFDVDVTTEVGRDGTITTKTLVKPRFWSKTNSLELVMKHLGMLEERFKVDQNIGIDPGLVAMLMEKLSGRPNNIIDARFIESKVKE